MLVLDLPTSPWSDKTDQTHVTGGFRDGTLLIPRAACRAGRPADTEGTASFRPANFGRHSLFCLGCGVRGDIANSLLAIGYEKFA
jgi:hypothetical protein